MAAAEPHKAPEKHAAFDDAKKKLEHANIKRDNTILENQHLRSVQKQNWW